MRHRGLLELCRSLRSPFPPWLARYSLSPCHTGVGGRALRGVWRTRVHACSHAYAYTCVCVGLCGCDMHVCECECECECVWQVCACRPHEKALYILTSLAVCHTVAAVTIIVVTFECLV